MPWVSLLLNLPRSADDVELGIELAVEAEPTETVLKSRRLMRFLTCTALTAARVNRAFEVGRNLLGGTAQP